MKLKRPSPAMVVAVVALVMSMTGGAIAAVNFANNAGAVDGKSAVKATKAGKAEAAGKLVATYQSGDNRGQLPLRIVAGAASQNSVDNLSESVALGGTAHGLIAVADNQTTAAGDADRRRARRPPGLLRRPAGQRGHRERDHADQHHERLGGPVQPLALARERRSDDHDARERHRPHVQRGSAEHVQRPAPGHGQQTVLVEGTAQQAGQGTADSSCIVWATAVLVD